MTRSGEEIRTSRSPAWTYASDAFAMLETLAGSADRLEDRFDDHDALAVLLVGPLLDAAVVMEDRQLDLVVGLPLPTSVIPGRSSSPAGSPQLRSERSTCVTQSIPPHTSRIAASAAAGSPAT